ncbi:hypothetical protein SAMN05660226_00241 [Parapedobacter luteus]|uniref:Uncharacterized protein n=1 Tax=Parapedobacter luteus TaxID=623280 RepID=A0A1T4ZX09_9SPHI|nr:hypothetical protein SAMN05660226_00241 [Parapedobacter luteus]
MHYLCQILNLMQFIFFRRQITGADRREKTYGFGMLVASVYHNASLQHITRYR